jgi:transcriptional regulator with XRE-family HTH domain
MTIAERIRLTRQQKGLSQKELSEKAKVNLKSLSRYELGTSVPPADILKSIADALNVASDVLLEDGNQANIIDKELLKKIEIIQHLEPNEKTIFNAFLDMMIRDYNAKKAYVS